MTNKQVLNAINSYKDDYYYVAQERLGAIHPDADIREDDILTELESIVKEDLNDKGFTKEEIEEILEQNLTKETAYKFMAYFISLYDEAYTVEEVKSVIDNHPDLDIEEFDEVDFEEIDKAFKMLK